MYSPGDALDILEGKSATKIFPNFAFIPSAQGSSPFRFCRACLIVSRDAKAPGPRRQKLPNLLLQTLMDDWHPVEPDYTKAGYFTRKS
jgi:hypothetical protein